MPHRIDTDIDFAARQHLKTLRPAGQLFVTTVISVGAVLLTISVIGLHQIAQPWILAALLLLSLMSSALKVDIPLAKGGSTISASYTVSVLTLLLVGTHAAVVVSAASAWTQCTIAVRVQNPRYRTLFSMAAVTIVFYMAGEAFSWFGTSIHPDITMTDLAKPLVGVALVSFIANTALVSLAIALTTSEAISKVWKENFLWSAPSYFVGALTAGAVAIATAQSTFSYWLAVLVGAPLYLIYRSYSTYVASVRHERRQKMVVDLVHSVGRAESLAELSEKLASQLSALLQPSTCFLWYRRGFQLVAGDSTFLNLERPILSSDESLIVELESIGAIIDVEDSAVISNEDCAWFKAMGVQLIVPVAGADERLIAVLMLGRRRFAAPYTSNDRALLGAISKEIAIVLQNLQLNRQLGEEQRIRREALSTVNANAVEFVKECPTCGECFDGGVDVCSRDGHTLTLSLPVSRTLDGRYKLQRLIGRGGAGAVYEAHDLELNRTVAVKVLMRRFNDSPATRRFRREAQAVARLNHPNIVGVYDYGSLDHVGGFLVMEHVAGRTMRDELDASGSMSPVSAAEWFEQMLSGIEAAHAAGIIHRDLKPENVIASRRTGGGLDVKILDFGLAKFAIVEPATTTSRSITVPGTVMGTFGYMSPEQLVGAPVDVRTDIFAVGVMVAESVTGWRPFSGECYADLVRSVTTHEYHLPGTSDDVSVLDRVLQRCLAKRAGERPDSTELRRLLIPALQACRPLIQPQGT